MPRAKKETDPLSTIDLDELGNPPWKPRDPKSKRWREVFKMAPWLRCRDRAVLKKFIESEGMLEKLDVRLEGLIESMSFEPKEVQALSSMRGQTQRAWLACVGQLGLSPRAFESIKDANRSAVPPPKDEKDPLDDYE